MFKIIWKKTRKNADEYRGRPALYATEELAWAAVSKWLFSDRKYYDVVEATESEVDG